MDELTRRKFLFVLEGLSLDVCQFPPPLALLDIEVFP